MSKLATLAGALFWMAAVPGTVQAADPCKGVKTKEDKFGGGQIASAAIQAIDQFHAIGLSLERKAGEVSLLVSVKEFGALNGGVKAGAEVLFSFEDGTVAKLATPQDATVQSYVGSNQVVSLVPYRLVLDAEALHRFASTPLSAMRVPILSTGSTHDWTPQKAPKGKLQKFAACLEQG